MCPLEHNMPPRWLYSRSVLVIVVLAIAQGITSTCSCLMFLLLHHHVFFAAGDCQCQQNFVLPGFNIQEQQAAIDYDISSCVQCNLESYTILVAGSGLQPTPLTNSTSGVLILSPSGTPPTYTLMMPDPRTVLSSTAATIIACNSESIRFTELGKFICLLFLISLSDL